MHIKVRDLRTELKSLVDVLEALSQTVQDGKVNLDSLELPLRTCNEICKGFSEFIDHNTTHSTDGKVSKRDWVKLEYRGDSITEFKEKLAILKSTISIAIGDANLRTAHVTHKILVEFQTTCNNAIQDLKGQYEITAEKLADQSLSNAVERAALEEEKASIVASLVIAQKALERCQPDNVNIIENNETTIDAIQAILPSDKYIIHARGNKAKDQSSQFIGSIDSATIQKAIQARGDKAAEKNTKEQTENSVAFSDNYGVGHKLSG
ncbi:hypothetical protein VF21_07879 [Pseudogymnoascus sp. 05NY08]|nr:hypothetical protein VF21_07879 [Pseudogymnoascus sp. 05NY08]